MITDNFLIYLSGDQDIRSFVFKGYLNNRNLGAKFGIEESF